MNSLFFRRMLGVAAALLAAVPLALGASLPDSDFCSNFRDSTLRVDCLFGGGGGSQTAVLLKGMSKSDGWAGRRTRLRELPLLGNGSVAVVSPVSGDTLYRNSFSSLFQEWLSTEEADSVARAFENSFLVPLPKGEADIVVSLRDNRHRPVASLSIRYSPKDELVAAAGSNPLPHRYIHRGADPSKAIDVAILAEGYRQEEMDSFISHADMIVKEILSYEPYASAREKFNFVAVLSPSTESGVSVPLDNDWKDTAFGSHFSTFHSPRYLTTPNLHDVHDALAGIPYEHIVILVNTDHYGGGGIFNSYLMTAARNPLVLPVSVHEFGHSFGGLADEYFYADEESGQYPLDVEPWEPNITTLVDFPSKWKYMLEPSIPVPTPWATAVSDRTAGHVEAASGKGSESGLSRKKSKKCSPKSFEDAVGVFEGGGYRSKGVYRPAVTCRMRDNYHPAFCPVCTEALARLIEFYSPGE